MDSLGAFPDASSTLFRLWSSSHQHCEVCLYDATGRAIRTEPLLPSGAGVFAARLTGVGHGARYRFVLDGTVTSDPYARFLPDGIDGPAMVYAPQHRWQHDRVARPLREHVIYELHVGAFTERGTYAAASEHLGDLVELGVTAIELMPVAAFGGRHGWGYDGVAHYAPHAAYGSPDELRALVDVAHGLGLAVFLDVVYNHFGPAGNVIGQYSPEYFTRVQTGWGEAPDFRNPWMRRYVLDNVRSWLVEFRFDGLRCDAVHAIVDPGEPHILREMTELAHAVAPGALMMAEDDRNDPAIIERHGFDAVWADDFHHAVHVTVTGERDGYYASYAPAPRTIADTIAGGWLYTGQPSRLTGEPRGKPCPTLPAEALIYCVQNHDQVGNRALGDRVSSTISLDRYCAVSALLLFLPMTPLLFMGQEWAASTPFMYFTDHDPELGRLVSTGRREEFKTFRAFSDPAARAAIPDPQAAETFAGSKLRWAERTLPSHARVLAMVKTLLALRRRDPVLRAATRAELAADVIDDLLVVRRWLADDVRTLVVNLGDRARDLPIEGDVVLATTDAPPHTVASSSAVILATRLR